MGPICGRRTDGWAHEVLKVPEREDKREGEEKKRGAGEFMLAERGKIVSGGLLGGRLGEKRGTNDMFPQTLNCRIPKWKKLGGGQCGKKRSGWK